MRSIDLHCELVNRLRQEEYGPPDFKSCGTRDDVLAACNSVYLTDGLHSLKEVPSSSVDRVFSQAVLEQVNRAEFEATTRERYRFLEATGVASHRIDLKDHLGGSLNNLRFAKEL